MRKCAEPGLREQQCAVVFVEGAVEQHADLTTGDLLTVRAVQVFHLVPAVIASLARKRKKKPENAKRISANFRYIASSQLKWISGFTRQPYVSPMTLRRLVDRGALGSLKK